MAAAHRTVPSTSVAMPRPVTLFTGQWADLPLDQLAPLAKRMGYDGLELACWGDHFDVASAAGVQVILRGEMAAADPTTD